MDISLSTIDLRFRNSFLFKNSFEIGTEIFNWITSRKLSTISARKTFSKTFFFEENDSSLNYVYRFVCVNGEARLNIWWENMNIYLKRMHRDVLHLAGILCTLICFNFSLLIVWGLILGLGCDEGTDPNYPCSTYPCCMHTKPSTGLINHCRHVVLVSMANIKPHWLL